MEPVLAKSLDRFLAVVDRWPAELSLADHLAADVVEHPLTPQDVDDEIAAMRIATMTTSEPALRTAYLMVHDEMERGLIPVVATRLNLAEGDLTVRLCAAAVTGAFGTPFAEPTVGGGAGIRSDRSGLEVAPRINVRDEHQVHSGPVRGAVEAQRHPRGTGTGT